MNKKITPLIVAFFFFLFIADQCFFFVSERQRGLVLQLGEPIEPVRSPGLNFKLPFIQSVVLLENRILTFVIPKTIGLSSDLKPFEIDNYACWKILDPVLFVRTLRSEVVATERLKNIVYSQLRAAIGSQALKDVVDTNRTAIMKSVLEESNAQAKAYGVKIIDVRIKRTDLPNRQAIFDRMNADRKKMANQYRAEGESISREIRSLAEKTRDIALATAQKNATITRGNADAKAMDILVNAISIAPDFYDFSKSIEVYRKSFKANSRFVFSSEDPLLKYMQTIGPKN